MSLQVDAQNEKRWIVAFLRRRLLPAPLDTTLNP